MWRSMVNFYYYRKNNMNDNKVDAWRMQGYGADVWLNIRR